jgi:hypothetical protein
VAQGVGLEVKPWYCKKKKKKQVRKMEIQERGGRGQDWGMRKGGKGTCLFLITSL